MAPARASSKLDRGEFARASDDADGDGGPLSDRLAAAERELDGLRGELERLHRLASIGTIAGMIAHEFNNILTPMMSYSQMALAAPEDQTLVQKSLQRTLAGSERAAKIADAILSFVRDDAAGSGQPLSDLFHVEHLPPASADVLHVVNDALTCLGRDAAQGAAGTRVQIPATLHAAIQPIALQQVIVNLVLNARNAMRGQGGMLEISASRWLEQPATPKGAVDTRMIDAPQVGASSPRSSTSTRTNRQSNATTRVTAAWICIVIRDTGRGMDAERLGRLFQPFATSTSGDRTGTGLGMVITRRLVERAGGWLTVESMLGRGTTTTIVVPEAQT